MDMELEAYAQANNLMCGMIDDDPDLACGTLDWEEAGQPIIPRDRWPDLIGKIDAMGGWLERLIMKIKAQLSEPSCVYNAGAQSAEVIWNKIFGTHNWIELSPMSGYRHNGSRFSGSSVAGCANWLDTVGLLPVNSQANLALVQKGYFQHTHPATGYDERFAEGWKSTAVMFRVQEWVRLKTVEQWFSALFQGFPCVGGRNRHCIMHCRPARLNGKYVSIYANSWGTKWGNQLEIATGMTRGFGVDSEGLVEVMVARGAWAPRTVRVVPWLDRVQPFNVAL
jgi:hypothetical protein